MTSISYAAEHIPSISHPLAKLQRAKEHLDSLNAEHADFSARHPIMARTIFNPDEQTCTVKIKTNTPPARLRLIFADYICNLRFSLDHLAWELALLKTTSPHPRTEFSICTSWSNRDKKKFERETQNIPDDARTAIQSFQPYHRAEGPNQHPLAVLEYFCDIVKHRLVPMSGSHLRLNIRNHTKYQVLEDGIIEFVVPTSDPNFMPDPHGSITFGVTRGQAQGISIGIEELPKLHDFVENWVFPEFTHFFS